MPQSDFAIQTIQRTWLGDRPIAVKRSRFGRNDIIPHRIPEHKLTVVLRGRGILLSNRGETVLRRGIVILTEPLVWHAYPLTGSFEVIESIFDAHALLDISGAALDNFPQLDRILRSRRPHLDSAEPWIVSLGPPQRESAEQNCLRLHEQSRMPASTGQTWLQQARLLLILVDALTDSSGTLEDLLPGTLTPPIDRIARTLMDHADQAHSLPSLAKPLGWNPAYLSRRFRSETGLGFTDFLNRIRIEQACRLLLATDLTVAEIATTVGYNEIPYFNRRFRRLIGCTPSQYRIGRMPTPIRSF